MWDDGNDDEFLRALEESRRMYEEVEVPRLSQQVQAPSQVIISDQDSQPGPSNSKPSTCTNLFKRPKLPVHNYRHDDSLFSPSTSAQSDTQDLFKKPQPSLSRDDKENEHVCEFYDGPEADGFSFKNGKVWVYPTSDNFPIRAYQRSIVETALFHNTLVSLPTGLGKTFIAAVVMYNFYMWYPQGKIIFMAPTKPLVAQQIDNCIDFMGIPESHTAEMTGAMHSKVRAGFWREKRVFFLTPQIVQNDLTANICPANAVKCVVIDEAHRALGDHAYAQVIRILNSYEARFRVLALSATPGSDLEAVQKVVSNLMISHIELREEDSPDIVQYTHERNLEKMVVDVGPTITRIRVKLVGIAADYAQRLQQLKLLFGTINSIPRFTVLKEWESFRREKSNTMDPATVNKINTDFATVLTFVHGLELLQTYGLRLLLNHLKNALKKGDQTANRLSVNEELKALMEEIDGVLNPIVIDGEEEGGIKKKIYGHPKLDRLQEVIVSHFENFKRKGEATRAIVFCEYREGVIEICDMLRNYEPLVKPVVFMGQSTGKAGKGISQKQQLDIMEKFKEGSYNTLISTSVGEEGLDIGEVDLIICFDAKNSPIRQVQRMGRTGRKRQGRIIMLLTRGKEEQKYNLGLHKKKNIKAVLVNKENLANHLLDESPRMLPPGVQPKYTERSVEPHVRKPKKSNQQDLRKMFAKRPSASSSGPSGGSRVSIGKTAYLAEDEFEELKTTWDIEECLQFNKIPERVEFWTKQSDEIERSDLTSTNIDPSTYLEFLRYPQRTHVVSNSSDSELLSGLLMWADERREGDESSLFRGLSSQVTSTQMWPPKSKKRGRPPATDLNSNDPPKKKGRTKKNATIDSHFLPRPKMDVDGAQEQSSKSKSRFIEDEEEDIVEIPQPMLNSSKPSCSSSTFLSPTKAQPPCKSVSPNHDSSFSAAIVQDLVTINSDDDDDDGINAVGASCGYADLSSQAPKQDLYRDLSRALRDQNLNEEDDCSICDALFLCKSLNKTVTAKKMETVEISWKNLSKSLEEALELVAQMTKEKLAQNFELEIEGQSAVSLMPKFEFAAEDEVVDGLLCGGVGDLSPARGAFHPDEELDILPVPIISSVTKGKKDPFSSAESRKHELENKNSCVLQQSSSSSPIKEPSIKTEQETEELKLKNDRIPSPEQSHFEFEDFLGLSKIDDIFPSQENYKEVKAQAHNDAVGQPIVKQSSLDYTKRFHQPQIEVCGNGPSHSHEPFSPVKVQPSCSFMTPPKTHSDVAEQVSPILHSQAIKKPRLGLKIRKQTEPFQKSKPYDGRSPDIFSKAGNVGGSSIDDEVTSSSQLMPTLQTVKPPVVNFEIFDDSLLQLSDHDDSNKVVIDEGLKEAIVKKALEGRSKKPEITFTQELSKMCESNLDGLTQVMEMYDAKDKREDDMIQRAHSSSPQPPEDFSLSPVTLSHDEMNDAQIGDMSQSINQGASEEDLFADCDDSLFCRIEGLEQLPLTPAKSECKIDAVLTEKKAICPASTEKVSTNNPVPDIPETMYDSMKSTSPILKPSQVVKRPSKLRLKKTNVDKQATVKESTPQIGTTSKTILERHDDCSQVDLNIFRDEFNNSWEYLQNVESSPRNFKSKPEIEESSFLCGEQATQHCATVEKATLKMDIQNLNLPNESSSDAELETAFAKLDADRKDKKKSFETTASSTPKIYRAKSDQQKSTVKSMKGFFSKKKLSLKDPSSLQVNLKADLISSEPREEVRQETSSIIKETSLLDFCDKSLIEDILYDEEAALINGKELSLLGGEKSSNQIIPDLGQPKMSFISDQLERKRKLSLVNKSDLAHEECRRKASAEMAVIKVKEETVVVLSSSSDDEDVIQNQRRGKNRLNITSSSEEGLKTHHSGSSVNRKRKDINSSLSSRSSLENDEHPSHSNRKSAHDLSAFCDDSILNDLVDNQEDNGPSRKGKDSDYSDEDIFVRRNRPKRPKKKKAQKKNVAKKKVPKKRNGFIMSEAEESEDGHRRSSDGESTSLDELDSSFINDSQPEASQSVVDIQDKYLEALRSPAGAVGRFKIPNYLPNADINVYSQYPDASELDQTYANDSFCVDNEPTQYEPEMSLLEIAEAKLRARRKDKRKRKKNYDSDSSGSDDLKVNNLIRGKRLKRIKMCEETILENDEQDEYVKESSSPKTLINDSDSKCSSTALERNHKQSNDLAKLLDEDDIDFTFLPDIIEAPEASYTEPQKPISSKFVKKVSLMSNHNFSKVNACSALQGLQNSSARKELSSTKSSTDVCSKPVNSGLPIKEKQGACTTVTSNSCLTADTDRLTRALIIASSRQIAQSPDVLRVLRVNHQIVIVPHSVPDADYILSWRKGASRIFASDLRDRKKLEDIVNSLKQSFSKPCLIIENDRLKLLSSLGAQKKGAKPKIVVPAAVDCGSNSLSPWSSASGCANAALLRHAGVQLLFSQNSDETAGYLAKLVRKETNNGHGIPAMAQNVSDEVESRLNFFACLPGINYAFSFKLIAKFGTLADFFKRCSSVSDIASSLELDFDTSRKIHKLLCEVYFSP